MRTLALLQLLLLPIAGLLHEAGPAAAHTAPRPSAACNPCSANVHLAASHDLAPVMRTGVRAETEKPRTVPTAKPSAACNPWSANYWGDVVIRSQVEADEYACFRRIVGSLTLIQSGERPFVLPHLYGIVGNVRIAFPVRTGVRAVAAMLPALREVSGNVEVEYTAARREVREAFGIERLAVRGAVRLEFMESR